MRSSLLLSLALLVTVAACERTKPAPAQTPASTSAAPNGPGTVAKIVFIDKENACDCTRERVENTWTAMQAALGTPTSPPVERIHVDTQAAQAGTYTASRPLMALPGIYFIDTNNAVVDMLQGEVKTEQVAAMLQRR